MAFNGSPGLSFLFPVHGRSVRSVVDGLPGLVFGFADRRSPGGHEGGPEYIAPQSISVPDAAAGGPGGGPPPKRRLKHLVAFLILLLLVGGALVFTLTREEEAPTEPPRPRAPVADTPESARPPAAEEEPIAEPSTREDEVAEEQEATEARRARRERAEDILSTLLDEKNALERRGVADWGGASYDELVTFSEQGDRHMRENDYTAAAEAYEKALSRAEALGARMAETLDRLLEEGQTALVRTNGPLAQSKFSTALKIDPTNAVATVGLERSRTIEEVETLMRSGRAHEARGRFALALTDFEEAARKDPQHAQARAAVERVTEAIKQETFQDLMSQGLKALRENELSDAESFFVQAKAFYPGAPEVEDALFRVGEARRLEKIDGLLKEAREAERERAWERAYRRYRDVLEIDPHIASAIGGKERTAQRIRLTRQMRHYLDKPELLKTPQGRDGAQATLEEVLLLQSGGEEWDQLLARFETMVKEATTPVRVVLESDGMTSVDVYKVGRLGSFESKELALLPGTYTVVGHRDGYKDIRVKLEVTEEAEPVHASVICREKI